MRYYANFISVQKLKIEFSLFHPSFNLQLPVDISPEIQGRVYGTSGQSPQGILLIEKSEVQDTNEIRKFEL